MGTPSVSAHPPTPPERVLGLGVLIGVLTCLVVAGALDWSENRIQPGGHAQFSLAAALAIGNGTGVCPTGIGASPAGCAYVFPIAIRPESVAASGLLASDLTFELQDASDSGVIAPFSVSLLSLAGCSVGTWNSTTSGWGGAILDGQCSGASPTSTPIVTGDTFLLTPVPRGAGLEFSIPGEHLIAVSVSDWYVGQIGAGIT